MALIYIFMASIVIIGILLISLALYTYSKLTPSCTLSSLRTKLQWAIGLGATFTTVGFGYLLCISECDCNNDLTRWKIYATLLALITLGSITLGIVVSIKNDAESGQCNIDIGSLTTFLITIASLQIALPVMYLIYQFIIGVKWKTKPQIPDDESEESKSLKSQSKKEAFDKSRRSLLTSRLNEQEAQLSDVQLKIDKLGNKRPDPADIERRELLIRTIADTNAKLKSVGKTSSASTSSQMNSLMQEVD